MKKLIQQLHWLITFVGFNGGQSYLATLVTPQNCTKMVRNLTLLYNLYILASDQKKLLFICATVEQLSLQKAFF